MIVRELITKLGFKFEDKASIKFNKAIYDIKKSIVNLGFDFTSLTNAARSFIGLAAGAGGMIALATSTARSVDELTKLSQQTNISVRDLQILEGVAQRSGVKFGEFTKSFTEFANNVRLSGSESNLFSQLGITLKDGKGSYRNTFDIYTDTINKINAIKDSTERNIYATTLLKTNNLKLLETFGSSREILSKYANDFERLGYIIDNKGVETTQNFIKSMNNFKIILKNVSTELSIQFMPSITRLSDKLVDWYSTNKKIISSGIEKFVNTLSSTFDVLFSILNVVSNITLSVISHFGGLENTVQILTTAFSLSLIPKLYEITKALLAFNFAMLTSPVFWFKTAILAVSLAIGVLVNDMYHWVKGNDSVLGRILGSWDGFKTSFFGIVDSMTGYFVDKFESVLNWFKEVFNSDILDDFKQDFLNTTNWIKSKFKYDKAFAEENINNYLKSKLNLDKKVVVEENILYIPLDKPFTSNLPTPSNNSTNTSNNTVNFTIENITVGNSSPEEAREVSKLIFEDIEQKMAAQWVRGINAFG